MENIIKELEYARGKFKCTRVHRSEINVYGMLTDCITEINNLQNELSEYKQKLADGRMIELPCKVGDTIYVIPSETNFRLNILSNHKENNKVYKQVVSEIKFYENNEYLLITCNGLYSVCSRLFNENWFLIYAEAEKASRERER